MQLIWENNIISPYLVVHSIINIMMRDDMCTTNQNWMDENAQNKNDDKLDANYPIGHNEGEFFKHEEYFSKDNIPMLGQPSIYYGGYEYHHPLYYDSMFAIDKDLMPPFQIVPPIAQELMYDHSQIMPFCNPDPDGLLKVYKPELHMGYWHQSLMHNPVQNIQTLLMPREFTQRPPQHYPIKQKMIKQQPNISYRQQHFFLRNQDDHSLPLKSRASYSHFANIHEIEHSVTHSLRPGPEARLIGGITRQERRAKIRLYQQKRKRRTYAKKVSYDCRKKVADQRIRIKGRFVTKHQALSIMSIGEQTQGKGDCKKDVMGVGCMQGLQVKIQ